jgi:hypothetical protein
MSTDDSTTRDGGSPGSGSGSVREGEARRRDAKFFGNYYVVDGSRGNLRKLPLRAGEIHEQLYRLTDGWPKRIGTRQLFAIEEDGRAVYLHSPARLFAWIDRLARIHWMSGYQYVSQRRFHAYMTMFGEPGTPPGREG